MRMTLGSSITIGALALWLAACDTFASPAPRNTDCLNGDCSATVPTGNFSPPPPVMGTGVAAAGGFFCASCVGSAGATGADGGVAHGGSLSSELSVFALTARFIVADPVRNRLYATVSGSDGFFPNRLVTIDPVKNTVIDDLAIGSEPTTLAISDDATTLWVSLSGAAALRRVDLTGDLPVAGDQFSLPSTCLGKPCIAGSMVMLPGTTGSVVTTLRIDNSSDSVVGVMALDDGIPRAMQVGAVSTPTTLTLGPAGYVFGFNDANTGFDFSVIRVTADGLTQNSFDGLVRGFGTELAYDNGLVYAGSGDILDVTMPDMPRRTGMFARQGDVLISSKGNALMLAMELSVGSVQGVLDVIDLDVATFMATTVMAVSIKAESSQLRNAVRVANRVAFLTGRALDRSGSSVFVLNDVAGLP